MPGGWGAPGAGSADVGALPGALLASDAPGAKAGSPDGPEAKLGCAPVLGSPEKLGCEPAEVPGAATIGLPGVQGLSGRAKAETTPPESCTNCRDAGSPKNRDIMMRTFGSACICWAIFVGSKPID